MKHKWIFGTPPNLEYLVEPAEECDIHDSPYAFEGGNANILAEVQHEMAIARGENEEPAAFIITNGGN